MAQQVQLKASAKLPARHAHTSCLLAVQERVFLKFFGCVIFSVWQAVMSSSHPGHCIWTKNSQEVETSRHRSVWARWVCRPSTTVAHLLEFEVLRIPQAAP